MDAVTFQQLAENAPPGFLAKLAGSRRQTVLLLALCLFAGLMWHAPSLLNDPDTQWHIATGRLIWATGSFPVIDTFSHTFAGAPWIAKEWLSQLALFAGFALGGWTGVAVLAAAAVAACFALVFDRLLANLRAPTALAVLLLTLLPAAPAFVARPHVLVLPVVALWFIGLTEALDRDRPPAWGLPLLMAAWANMHASFPLGLVLAGILAGEAVARSPGAERKARLLRWAAFLLLSAAAACLSPYGAKTLLVVANLFSTPEAMRYITEWQPLGLGLQGFAAATGFVLALVPLALRFRQTAFRLLAVLLLGYLTVAHVRFGLLFGVIAPILAAAPAARAFPALRAPEPRRASGAAWALAGFLALGSAGLASATHPQPRAAVMPVAAVDFAQRQGLTGPVYNDFDFAGFLIARGIKTFIDGRTDQLFASGFSTGLNDALAQPSNAPFEKILDRYAVTWALVKSGSPDARHLATMPGWTRLFDDGTAAVYARR